MCTLNYVASFNFFDSSNPSILWSLNFLLPKASASGFYCYQIVKKNALEFKILSILYFYCVIIIFKLTLQQVLPAIVLNKVRHFCPYLSGFSIPCAFEKYNKSSLWRKNIRSSSSTISILYFSQGNLANWKHSVTIFYCIAKSNKSQFILLSQ